MSKSNISINNQAIAKNTVFMYLRMFITMSLGLYTSRVILRTLGVDDYGLYNVIGGIIAMFGFLNGAMTNTTSRYITFYLAKDNKDSLCDIFSMSIIIHACIAFIILIAGETIGLWYLYNRLVVPEGRLDAAFWLYQLSIASTLINILYVPFNATIVAHEKMSAFAYISIMDSVLKVLIGIGVGFVAYDKLIIYGLLMFCISIINIIIYLSYCKKKFDEVSFHWFWDEKLFKEMFGFAGWSMMGNFSYLFYTQGINLIINAFCGTGVNAARGITVQVESVVRQFASNVQTAINPQIIKSYSEGNMDRMYTLIFASSRYCFYLLFLFSLPLLLEAEYILHLWLGVVPEHTVNFVRLTLVLVLLDGMINPLFTANLATGRVKIYHIVISVISYSFMPITYFMMKYTIVPEIVFVCQLVCGLIGLIARVIIAKKQHGMSIELYMKKVFFKNVLVCILSVIFPIIMYKYLDASFMSFILVGVVCVLSVFFSVFLLGINKKERIYVLSFIKRKTLTTRDS